MKNSLLKAVARRNKADSISSSSKKTDQSGVNYEKPSILMFFPLLRVLGKGSFGKVRHVTYVYM